MDEPGPLTDEQKAALEGAATARQALMRPARLATFNLWSVGIFGGLSVLWGLMSGGGGVVVGLALLAVAWNERRGRDRYLALDPEGARILGWNQLALGGVVVAYCLATIVRTRAAPGASTLQLEELAGLPPGAMAELTALAYGAVALAVGVVQALLARYHFAKGPFVEAFRRDTAPWIVEILAGPGRAGG